MKFLDEELDLAYIDGRKWRVKSDFSYAVGAPDGATVIHIGKGFVTDFASVPRLLWPILPPTGRYGKAVLLHDCCYQTGKIGDLIISRKYADDVLAESARVLAAQQMLTYGARHTEFWDWCARTVLYVGVRIGGWRAWGQYRRAQAARA